LSAVDQVNRVAALALKRRKSALAISEYEREQQALHANRERLKAERLAREAHL
jgi:hypothetical protein